MRTLSKHNTKFFLAVVILGCLDKRRSIPRFTNLNICHKYLVKYFEASKNVLSAFLPAWNMGVMSGGSAAILQL